MKLPTLYKTTSTNKIQVWEIESFGGDACGYIKTTYGLTDGKKQNATEAITEGKNIGKTNATTALQQAQAEAQSQWEKKVKKGYVQNIEDATAKKVDTNFITGGIDPMLAHVYEKQGHKIQWPAYVQPKLNGHRCIAIVQDGVCTLWTRTRKPITGVPHIARQLEQLFPQGSIILDGELYNHEYKDRFEDLTSLIRQETPKPGHEVVEFWIYDVVNTNLSFAERKVLLDAIEHEIVLTDGGDIVGRKVPSIKVLATFEAQDQANMIEIFGVFIKAGYEGLMVRNASSLYVGKRSYGLQKVKVMQDAEFSVVDVTTGKGKMAGLAMFHCETTDGKEFRVKMKGKLDDLAHYLENKDDYIGEKLTVQFQNYSADGIPVFPVALHFGHEL